jgi:hypothetical protein
MVLVQIKNLRFLVHLLEAKIPYDEKLIRLVQWFAIRYSHCRITSGYQEGSGSVHNTVPCRGIDIGSRECPDPEGIEQDINTHWIYDPQRPQFKCCLYHNVGSGWHFHLQTHPNTFYKSDVGGDNA